MKISSQMDNKLLEYLDGTLSSSEKETLEQELGTSPALAKRLEELKQVTTTLKGIHIEQPSTNFTQRVMEQLNQYPVSRRLSIKNGIFLLAGILIAVGICAVLLSAGVFDTPGSIDLSGLVQQNEFLQRSLPAIPINGKLVVNIIILLNLAIAFLVLDRAILKPWFERRTRMHF